MNAITVFLTDLFGPLGPLLVPGFLALILFGLCAVLLINRRPDPMDKFARMAKQSRERPATQSLRRDGGKVDKLERYSTFLEPQDAQEFSAVKLKLVRAGYRSPNAVRMYHFAQFFLGISFLVLGLAYTLYVSSHGAMGLNSIMLHTLLPGAVGYMLPKYWVTKRLQQRQEEITNGFPDSLDMMLVCVEAGQSMDQSIGRVAREIRAGYPALADEYEIVTQEVRAGKDKSQVLKDMGERAGVTDVSNFVTVLVQSAAFGTSIAEALRVYAAEMRDKRVMRAEEKANTLPTKMTLATMMLTVPPLLIMLLGPSVFKIVETFAKFG